MSKFLEALQDNEQRTALEYPTVPETLDATLRQAIHYREAAQKANDVDDGFNRAYRVQDTLVEAPTGEASYPQYPDRAQVVDHSTVKIQPKTVAPMVPQAAVPPQQATEPGNKDDEPRFSMREVQHLLEYTMAARSVPNHNEGQGNTTGSSRLGDRKGTPKGKEIIECDYCTKKGHKAYECRLRIRDFKQNFAKQAREKKCCYECHDPAHLQRDCPFFKACVMANEATPSQPSRSGAPAMLALTSGPSAHNGRDQQHNTTRGSPSTNTTLTSRGGTTSSQATAMTRQ